MEEQKKTLNDLLLTLTEADEGLLELSSDDMKEVIGEVKGKVDGIKHILSKMEFETLRMKSIIDEFTKRKKTIDNGMARLKDYVKFSMEQGGTTKLVGDLYSVQLQSKVNISPANKDLNEDDVMAYSLINPKLVKMEYKFNLPEFKKQANADVEFMKTYADVTSTKYPVFRTVNKTK